jgi:hypothetical protein
MKTTTTYRCLMGLAGLLLCTGRARGYPVEWAVSLEKLTGEAGLIFKGTAVSDGRAQDNWFQPYPGFITCETQFKVISVIKGEGARDRLLFRHYDKDPQSLGGHFQPQYYHFESGRTYIVFAKHSESAGVFRQLWMYHKTKVDQGVLCCANDKPAARKTVREVLWTELTALLASPEGRDVTYALDQLDQMSAGQTRLGGTSDLDRTEVLAAVRGSIAGRDPKVAQAAIRVLGSHNPYMDDDRTLSWLATVGSAPVPGIAKRDPKMENLGGTLYQQDLVALADSHAPVETRALAIRALGLVREPPLAETVARWLTDPAPAVRASAALLLADFPGPETCRRLTILATDAAPEVRVCVARAAGFAQQVEMAEVLARLLADPQRQVREAAAMSLLSFSPRHETIARIFSANLTNAEFQPLFLIALARENPAGYLDALALAVEQNLQPENFWGGQLPAFTAWEILFRYLQSRPADEIRSGKWDRYLDAMEKVGNYSSSEPRDIYAFYRQRGMTDRAKRFRQKADQTLSYDIEHYFKQVDENPSLYQRQ